MKAKYNFFSGFNKFKFRLVFNYLIFVPLWILFLLILWIGYLSFLPSLLLSGVISLAISLGIAFFKTPTLICYTINKSDYILFNPNIYYKKYFDMGVGSFILKKNKYIPLYVGFIDDFLDDFKKIVQEKSQLIGQYFKIFIDINIDNVNYVFVSPRYSKSEIQKAFQAICSLDIKTVPKDDFVSVLGTFQKIINQGKLELEKARIEVLGDFLESDNPILKKKAAEVVVNEGLRDSSNSCNDNYEDDDLEYDEDNDDLSNLTLDQQAFIETHKKRSKDAEEKFDEIWNKMTGKDDTK